MPDYNIGKLNDLYNDSETVDREILAEMRSNILLVSGDHYKKISSKIYGRLREEPLAEGQKIRVTKNHCQKIAKIYTNNILAHAPGVRAFPHNESELQDQKTAHLVNSVWSSAKARHKLKEKIRNWAENYVDIGEVAVKIYWDPNKGQYLGQEQAVGEMGEPLFVNALGETTIDPVDQMTGMPNQPKAGERARFSGDLCFKTIYAYNLRRAPQAETLDESPYLIEIEMMDKKDAMALVGDDEEKKGFVEGSSNSYYKVFDSNRAGYIDSKDQVMLRNYYFRPSVDYPQGYYFITTEAGILFEGELPFGIFPIQTKTFDKVPTSPRGRSILRVVRPYQASINLMASKIAEHQLVLGDDKIVYAGGAKVAKGAEFPGIRTFAVSGGPPPTVIPGRSGEQYFQYLNSQIQEMYQVANVAEDTEENNQQLEAYTLLFRSAKQKKKFQAYIEKFEDFLIDVFKTYIKLAQKYFDEEMVIKAIGAKEAINIAEFKQIGDFDYAIKAEPVSDDIESSLGKQIQINHLLQYVGKELPKETIGKIIKLMPYVNGDQIFGDLTIDDDCVEADILSLDRGLYRPAQKYDNHQLYIKRLTHRMKQNDFEFLDPQIQQMYQAKLEEHQTMESENIKALQEAQSGFIPSGGGLAKADVYEPDPNSPEKQRRATFPVEALQWLKKRLDQQGLTQQQLSQMDQANQAEILNKALAMTQQPFGAEGVPMSDPMGQAVPQGV